MKQIIRKLLFVFGLRDRKLIIKVINSEEYDYMDKSGDIIKQYKHTFNFTYDTGESALEDFIELVPKESLEELMKTNLEDENYESCELIKNKLLQLLKK